MSAAGVSFEDDDIVILALKCLPSKYNTFRIVIRGRENVISLKNFRAQLLAEEVTIENNELSSSFVIAMLAKDNELKGKRLMLEESLSQVMAHLRLHQLNIIMVVFFHSMDSF